MRPIGRNEQSWNTTVIEGPLQQSHRNLRADIQQFDSADVCKIIGQLNSIGYKSHWIPDGPNRLVSVAIPSAQQIRAQSDYLQLFKERIKDASEVNVTMLAAADSEGVDKLMRTSWRGQAAYVGNAKWAEVKGNPAGTIVRTKPIKGAMI